METRTNQIQAQVDLDLQLLYKCFLGRWLDIAGVLPNQKGYLVYFQGNDITTGLRITIEDRIKAKFF